MVSNHMPGNEVVLIGIGEIGGVLAKGFLRLGFSVHPVTRESDIQQLAARIGQPALVIVAVGENALSGVLDGIPEKWRSGLCLLQNELLPDDWQRVDSPTVISIWFEKKPGIDAKVIIPSPVFGPQSELMRRALATVNIPVTVLADEEQLLFQLVLKNLYILTSNIAGLRTGGNVGELWQHHQTFARQVAGEIISLQEALTNRIFDREALIAAMVTAFEGDPQHQCMGRSARARLQRALSHAERLKLDLPQLRALQQSSAEQ
ncbi:MAG: hypothetical protein JAY75_23390 [Candidatus Thiodiazotropha taylori]|nr:hypothetical protein [Candidatus Thiodiazotropha taylori]MCW4226186.1 hypothetical protein [Candidatus Thiodiazotropha endolucinida]MCG7881123.1 hypothetical protein [Candidatus Thiodiazotropha taylori]MCG7887751.1 hypothetical protein [Candidatus Thiodiazotropha taylori]MCG7889385.1 hypothetical protein [Candidatus Thiodiazotropha taylori]